MHSTEVIELRKIYVGSAYLFSFIYSLFLGLIVFVAIMASGFFAPGGIVVGEMQVNTFNGVFNIALISFALVTIFGFVFCILSILFYNLISRMGLSIKIGLAETDLADNHRNNFAGKIN